MLHLVDIDALQHLGVAFESVVGLVVVVVVVGAAVPATMPTNSPPHDRQLAPILILVVWLLPVILLARQILSSGNLAIFGTFLMKCTIIAIYILVWWLLRTV